MYGNNTENKVSGGNRTTSFKNKHNDYSTTLPLLNPAAAKTAQSVGCTIIDNKISGTKEQIEAFIFTRNIKKITAITMNREGSISHPLSKIEILPFDIWAIGD